MYSGGVLHGGPEVITWLLLNIQTSRTVQVCLQGAVMNGLQGQALEQEVQSSGVSKGQGLHLAVSLMHRPVIPSRGPERRAGFLLAAGTTFSASYLMLL